MGRLEDRANLLVRQFENTPGRRSWENKDDSSRLKFVEDCIRLVEVWERRSTSGWKYASGLKETLSAIRNGEEMLGVYNVNADDVKVIAEELKTNTSLLWLGFHVCQIGPEGARHLSDMLRENSTLLHLHLYNEKIGPEGARHLSDMLRENSTLLFLQLYDKIGPEGARHLSDALRENCTLLYLNIERNQIGPEGARHLSDMLRENCTLLHLNLWGNEIGPEGARHLSDILRENDTLLNLNLWGNEIGPEGARHLSDMLRENNTLLDLEIGDNNIEDEELESHIRNEIQSRKFSSSSSWQLSLDECRSFLQSNFSVHSWTSVRQDISWHLNFDQLPPEMWGEILGFLTNDSSSLHESILVFDLRSGFYFPYPTCKFSSQETPLLSMIPCIEGLFRQDQWTRERLYRARLRIPSSFFQEEMRRHWNIEESSESSSNFEL